MDLLLLFIAVLFVVWLAFPKLQKIKDTRALIRHAPTLLQWLATAETVLSEPLPARRWVTHAEQQKIDRSRPSLALSPDRIRALLNTPSAQKALKAKSDQAINAYSVWLDSKAGNWAEMNEAFTRDELRKERAFFNRIEKMPLTDEQARAVICFDDKVQLIAAAGSGKTSVMVAKAAYAIKKKIVSPDEIIMLAFNKSAAEELQERASLSFERAGMEEYVKASTFHALGLKIIGAATGKRPDVPDWTISERLGHEKIQEILEKIKESSPALRFKISTFPMMANPQKDLNNNPVLQTLQGEEVKSLQEMLIADWLYLHNIAYEYERPYPIDTATADHRQYKPDFYYPSLDLYHEHFAINSSGKAPNRFKGYAKGVEWKRNLHAEHGTKLIETYSYQFHETGDIFQRLEAELKKHGAKPVLNPSRQPPNQKQLNARLPFLLRSFIAHVKSNGLAIQDLEQRLRDRPDDILRQRQRFFLSIAVPVMKEWDAALAAENGIDFEDMLNMAADHVERGAYKSPYKLIMADEFQDASIARARLCKALSTDPGAFFFAVGDDWQSINRFAGADLSIMTDFTEFFGHSERLKLEQTFRCPQSLCDISSQFITLNPTQIKKRVFSAKKTPEKSVLIIQPVTAKGDSRKKSAQKTIAALLGRIERKVAGNPQTESMDPRHPRKRASIYILGRYNFERPPELTKWKKRYKEHLEITFMTIHKSKGGEADYVIMPSMHESADGLGFPCTIADDPILALAMPNEDDFLYAEERRLFYVALTRARKGVFLIALAGRQSRFVTELIERQNVPLQELGQ